MSNNSSESWQAVYVGCGDWDLKGPLTREDWHLAAAAPDLLEACKAALSDDQPYIEKCKAAIAKATGEKE